MAAQYDRKDQLYRQAKEEGYRSRAAYKLIEIDKKFSLLKPGGIVIDLGCFPGGWLQIAAKKLGSKGKVVGIDLDDVPELKPGVDLGLKDAPVHVLKGDVNDLDMQQKLFELCGRPANVVLSDMSPKLTGVRFSDAVRSAELVEMAGSIASKFLAPGGSFVAKIFPGSESDAIFQTLRRSYQQFTRHVLESSRKTSNEYYFVGRGFKV